MKYLLNLFLLVSAFASGLATNEIPLAKPKFKHEERVVIVSGYFENYCGNVVGCVSYLTTCHYTIRTDDNRLLGSINQAIPEKYLKRVE